MGVFLKYVVFSLNLIHFIIGGAAVGLGVWVLLDLPDFAQFFGYGVIVGGGVVILASCFGFTSHANKCSLMLHVISCTVLIAIQAYVTYKCFTVDATEIEDTVYEGLDKSFKNGNKKVYHNLEKTIKCCGVNKPADGDYPAERMPKVCCMEYSKGKICDPSHIWPSCTRVITDHIVEYARPLAYGIIGFCVIQIVMIFSACVLTTYAKKPHGHQRIHGYSH